MNRIKALFTPPSAAELAMRELADAERELLASQTAAEAARATVAFNNERVARLRRYLGVSA